MKKLVLLSVFLISVITVNAQEIFSKGTNILNVGVGVGSGIPVEASFEHSIVDGLINGENGAIGIGAYGSWYSDSEKITGGKWKYNHIVLGARGAFHYQFVDKLDTYAGAMLGYNIASSKWEGDGTGSASASGSAFDFSLFAGARYFFKPTFGVYAEAGYGVSYLSLGVTFKF